MHSGSPLVSVIIIVKDGQSTLPRAMDSAIHQTFQNFELILVNDGSTDNTLDIAEDYTRHNSKIKVINLPKNLGRASARNIGLDKAMGKFVLFLDVDDALPKNSLQDQVAIATKYNSDIVFMRTKAYKIDSGVACESHYTDKIVCRTEHNISVSDHPELINNNQIVGRLYRLSFLNDCNIIFSTKRRCAEDVLFNLGHD